MDYNQIIHFMKEFDADFLKGNDELIIDEETNIYINLNGCKDIEDVKTRVVYNLCRPIGKGLEKRDANRLLLKLNKYFKTNLTKEDLRLMYIKLCSVSKFDEFKSFIQRGFPMEELK